MYKPTEVADIQTGFHVPMAFWHNDISFGLFARKQSLCFNKYPI